MRHQFMSSIIALSICLLGAACAIDGTKDFQKEPFVPTAGPAPYIPQQPAAQTRKVVILHTNDEHSHLLGFGSYTDFPFLPDASGAVTPTVVGQIATKVLTSADQQTVGGIVRRQYLVNKIRAESTDPVLLLSAGDSTMGTIFHPATPVAAPDFMAMTFLGYDFATFGNHEFDFGPDVLASAVSALGTNSFGGGLPFIATNMHFDDVQAGKSGDGLKKMTGEGDSGAPIVRWATKTLANGLKVGFIGYMGFEAALVAPAASPISFSLPMNGAACSSVAPVVACAGSLRCYRGHCVDLLGAPAAFMLALAGDIQPVVTTLRDVEKCDLVVALSHAGSVEDETIATYTSGIDVIIGGHSHEEIPPTVVDSQLGGQSIVVQAGSYGRMLGQLTITVDPAGVVGYVVADSLLHPIDYHLDAEILSGSDMLASPPVLSPAFEHALSLTGGILGPVMAGMNAALGPAFPEVPSFNVVAPLVTSDHNIEGETNSTDSALAHLVTDADLLSLSQTACLPRYQADGAYKYAVAVQANGVLRESLRFSKSASQAASFADIFGVVPLGASPFAPTLPGYPLVMFQLDVPSLFAGLDVGVTKGIDDSDNFFLTYAGMRVTYDTSFAALDPADLQKDLGTGGVTTATGRIMTVDVNTNPGSAPTWVNIYTYTAGVPFYARWSNINPATDKILVVTNMYLAGFLEAFGITPYNAYTGGAITANPAFGALSKLAFTFLCQEYSGTTGLPIAPDCGHGGAPIPGIRTCLQGAGDMTAGGTWAPTLVEVKEWAVLTKFMLNPAGFDGEIPATFYKTPLTLDWTTADPFDPMATNMSRVKDVTP
jgi:5'-nucleotidase / UDP-sugar diphosphatase